MLNPQTILVTNKTNILYLSRFRGTAGYLVLHGKKGFLLTDSRYHLVAKTVLPKNFRIVDITDGLEKSWKKFLKRNRIKKIGFEGNSINFHFWKWLKKIAPSVSLVDIGEKISRQRMIKKSFEIACIRRAQEITDKIFAILRKWLHSDFSEKAIAWKIQCLAHELGADDLSFPPIIGVAKNSASPHHHNTEKKLKRGDIILVDMGVVFQGYCSDMTRVLFTKTPTAEQEKIYELVKKAQEHTIENLRAGMTGKASDGLARSIIIENGYGKYFGHSLGHGVGLDIHELPNLAQKYKGKIPEGSVVTVEPGIYLPGKFGVRLEDMVLVRKNGVKNFTKSPKDLNECIIRLKK